MCVCACMCVSGEGVVDPVGFGVYSRFRNIFLCALSILAIIILRYREVIAMLIVFLLLFVCLCLCSSVFSL